MKKVLSLVAFAVIISFCFLQLAEAGGDEVSALKKQMRSLQSQVRKMQGRINELESMPAGSGGSGGAMLPDNLELSGWASFSFTSTEQDVTTDEAEPHFAFDGLELYPTVHLTEDIEFASSLDFYGDSTGGVYQSVVKFKNLPYNSVLTAGLDGRFCSLSRVTSRSPFARTAFWRYETVGLTLSTTMDPFYGYASLTNGYQLSTRAPGKDNSYPIIRDLGIKSVGNFEGVGEVGLGLGFAEDLGELGSIDVLGWTYFGEMSEDDVLFLQSNLHAYTSAKDDRYRAGINLLYDLGNFHFIAQYIAAEDGEWNRDVWFIQPYYEFSLPFDWKYAKDHKIIFRYGQLEAEEPQHKSKSGSWSREEYTLSLVTDVADHVTLKTEYTADVDISDSEDCNAANNEFVMALQVTF